MNDEHACFPGCLTCDLAPRDGESNADWLARVRATLIRQEGDTYRAPGRKRSEAPCVDCGTRDFPIEGRGKCRRCYHRWWQRQRRERAAS